jgi:hypothetical protein
MSIQSHSVYVVPHHQGILAQAYPLFVFFKNCPRPPVFSGSNGRVFETTLLVISIQFHSVKVSCLAFQ